MRASRLPKRSPRIGRPPGSFTQHRTLDRLIKVIEHSPVGVSLAELAASAGVSQRSVRRYLKELKASTEIESVATTPGGARLWRKKASERGRTIMLRRAQGYALVATRQLFDVFKGSALFDEIELALREVLTLAQRPVRASAKGDLAFDLRLDQRFMLLGDLPRNYAPRSDELDALFNAVADLRVVTLRLRARADAKPRTITFHPWALLAHRGVISVVGKDTAAARLEVVPLDAVVDVRPSENERFTVPTDFDITAFFHGDQGIAAPAKRHAIVDFDARVADEVRARKVHPAQKQATAKDGRVRLSVPIADQKALVAWILGFGDAAEVAEPPDLVLEVAQTLRRAAARYKA